MIRATTIRFLVALLIVSLAGGAAAAVTRTVPSVAFPTIQQAITASGNDDVIVVQPGVYFESLLIPAGTTGLRITGQCYNEGAVVIDGTFGGADNTILDIDGDDADIQCLTLRHGSNGIDADADDLRVYRVHFLTYGNGQTDGINVRGDRFQIYNNVFKGHDNNAIDADGDDGLIRDNTIEFIDSTCVELDGDRNDVRNNTIRHCDDGDGVRVSGSWNTVRLNTFSSIDQQAIDSSGPWATISHNTMWNIGSDGIRSNGDDARIEYNELTAIESSSGAINVDGNRTLTQRNTVTHATADAAYDIDGSDVRVEYNSATNVEGGYEVRGANPVVRYNTAENTGNVEGFDVDCVTSCSSGRVESNLSRHTAGDAESFDIFVAPGLTGFTIMRNTGEYASGACMLVDADGASIRENRLRWCGAEGEAGLEYTGDGSTLAFNVARDAGGDGIRLRNGSDNELSYNQGIGNLGDGIHVCPVAGACDRNLVTRSTTRLNLGEGLENDGSATTLTYNYSSANRTDCAEGGSNVSTAGTTCVDGSNFAADGTVDD